MTPSAPIIPFLVQDDSEAQPKNKYELVHMTLEEEIAWLAENGGPVECDNKMCPVWDECGGGLKRYRELGLFPWPENENQSNNATVTKAQSQNFSDEVEPSLSPEQYPWLRKSFRDLK